jgi:hypothetical protein
MPELDEETETLLNCFRLCDSQLRSSMGGVFAMDWNSVDNVARALNIDQDVTFYAALKQYETVLIEELNRKE